MQLADIRVEVQRRSGRDYSDDAMLSLINEALTRYSLERDWPWLEATAYFTGDGTSTTFGLSRRRSVSEVKVAGQRVELTKDHGALTWYGWWVAGNDLNVNPPPGDGQEVAVLYYRLEDPLASPGDEPFVPDEHIYGVLDLAASMVLDRTGRSEDADAYRARYREWLAVTDRLMHPTNTVRIRTRADSPL